MATGPSGRRTTRTSETKNATVGLGGIGIGWGGGSFDAGTDQILAADFWSGNGEVVITPVFAGMPGNANCHGQSVSGLAQQYGGLDAAAMALGYSGVQTLQVQLRDIVMARRRLPSPIRQG